MFLARFSLENVHTSVLSELTDDAPVREELMELQLALDLGEIDEEEYLEREAAIMERLRAVREWRKQLGMDTGAGPYRLARPPENASAEPDAPADVDAPDPWPPDPSAGDREE